MLANVLNNGWKAKDWWCLHKLAIVGRYVLMRTFLIKYSKHSIGSEIQLTEALIKLDEFYGVEGKTYMLQHFGLA